jgi:GNAT superfamily N-acetyltransferase
MITVTEATIADSDAILALFDEFSRHLKAPDVPSKVGRLMLEHVLQQPQYHVFLARESQSRNAMGMITLYELPNIRHGYTLGHIEDFFVSEQVRRQGVGSALFSFVKKYCADRNISVIKLDSGNELTSAHRFYESQGGKTSERFFRFDISLSESNSA